ncbi:MAG: hypothetical protein LBD98_03275 [Endomicrobium sp.]|nr:hypothetical protein [Endomicrobium sp.]
MEKILFEEELRKQNKQNLRKKRWHWAILSIGMFVLGTGFGMCLAYRHMMGH